MRKYDNSKVLISSNFLFSICLLIMLDTLILVPSLRLLITSIIIFRYTSPNYTSLHLSTLYFLSFTLHNSPIWFNPSTFPIILFHLTSLNQTQYGSHIPQLISKVMNPLTALKNFSPFHLFILFDFFFTFPINPSLDFTLPFASTNHFPSLPLPSLFTFYRLYFLHCFTLS